MIAQVLTDKTYKEFLKVGAKATLSLIKNDENEFLVKFIRYLIDSSKNLIMNTEALTNQTQFNHMKDTMLVKIFTLLLLEKKDSVYNYLINQMIRR